MKSEWEVSILSDECVYAYFSLLLLLPVYKKYTKKSFTEANTNNVFRADSSALFISLGSNNIYIYFPNSHNNGLHGYG